MYVTKGSNSTPKVFQNYKGKKIEVINFKLISITASIMKETLRNIFNIETIL